MADVFISYQRAEREAVQIIADKLTELKLEIWFDKKLRPGGSFDEEIALAIKDAKSVLRCWTPAALASEWVRGEATLARQEDRFIACFLEPTELIPPFNLTHTEDLTAWAGQEDDPAWLKVLERIGELVGRPGLATYHAAMRPGATVQELKAWASSNGADPLAETLWGRVATLEGEGAEARLAREKQEARARDHKRKAQAARSRELARARGLRDPKRERRRWMILAGAIIAIGFVAVGGVGYSLDAQRREQQLRNNANTPGEVRRFLGANGWHPIADEARAKLTALDAEAWRQAASVGTIDALEHYKDGASQEPQGQFLRQAEAALQEARRVKAVQEQLARLRVSGGRTHGALDTATRQAIKRFRYRWLLPVSETIDDLLFQRLDQAMQAWMHPRLDELVAQRLEPPTDEDYMRIAERLGIDAATLGAVIEVATSPQVPAFGSDRRPFIVFEPSWFSRLTQHRFDLTHPAISSPGREQADRWRQVEEAFGLDPVAALKATSWGRFMIMGAHHSTAGFDTVGEFVRFMSESESNQLEAVLLSFIPGRHLTDELQRHDWKGFARGFQGPAGDGRFADRLRQAYERRLAQLPGAEATGVQSDGQ